MEKLTYYYQIVEKAILKLGLNPEKTRSQVGKWTLRNADIPVWIDVFYHENHKRNYFLVVAPSMKIPEDRNTDLAWKLLSLNNDMQSVSFITKNDSVYIKSIRETEGLDISEAFALITRVGNYTMAYRKSILGISPPRPVSGTAKSDPPLNF